MSTYSFGDKTVSDLETALDTFCASMTNGAYKHVWVHITAASGVFAATNYTGFVECNLSGARWRVTLSEQASYKTIVGWKTSSGWNWDSYALKNLINVETDFTSQTTVSYTGASITIPANSFYAFQANAVYSAGEPLEIYICSSSTQFETFRTLAGGTLGTCSLCGYTPSETTYYIWAKYRNSSTNKIRLRGWYETA